MQRAVPLLHLVQQRGWEDLDAPRRDRVGQRVPEILVEPPQRQSLAINQLHLRTEPGEDAGEFDPDVTAADDGDPLRPFGQMKGGVRVDAQFVALDVRLHHRTATGRDDDALRGDPARFESRIERS